MEALQEEVFNETYRHGDESVEDMWRRVAKFLSCGSIPDEIRYYHNLMDWKTTLGGRILSNAGIGLSSPSLLNCYVLGSIREDKDSVGGIYEDLTNIAVTLKSEGGVGFNFSHLRPKGSYVSGIGLNSPGAVKFMELFDKSSELITSCTPGEKTTKNKSRRGAQMGVINIWHPDVIDFINAKQVPNRLTKFNLSVNVSDKFMKALETNAPWNLEFPDTTVPKYKTLWTGNIDEWKDLGLPTIIYETLPAKELWEILMKATYNRNEPGVLFGDTCNKRNNLYASEYIDATNP